MARRRLLFLAVLLLLAAPLAADSVYLSGGTCLKGTITAEHPDRIEIKLESGEVKTIPRSEIAMIKKGSTCVDEFKTRLSGVKDDDLDGLFALAAWCGEKKLTRQRTQVMRKVVKLLPDCPAARRAMNMVHNGKKWVKDKRKGKVEKPKPGAVIKCGALGIGLKVPVGFSVPDSSDEGFLAEGPARYRKDVLIEVDILSRGIGERFQNEDEAWSKPKSVAFGKISGLVAERTYSVERDAFRVREYALTNGPRSFSLRLTTLSAEFTDWIPHLDLVLKDMKSLSVKPDYVNRKLGIGFCYPKDAGWEIRDSGGATSQFRLQESEDEEIPGLIMMHEGEDAQSVALLIYLQGSLDDVGGDLEDSSLDDALRELAGGGDLKDQRDCYLGMHKAKLWDFEMLAEGVPVRGIFLVSIAEEKAHIIMFQCHERSIAKFRPVFERVRTTFTFEVK